MEIRASLVRMPFDRQAISLSTTRKLRRSITLYNDVWSTSLDLGRCCYATPNACWR